jgi:hypothetical protein
MVEVHHVEGVLLPTVHTGVRLFNVLYVIPIALSNLAVRVCRLSLVLLSVSLVVVLRVNLVVSLADFWVFIRHRRNLSHRLEFRNPWVYLLGMKIGRYELRKPFVKYVDMPIEKELFLAVKKSILEDMLKEVEREIEGE